MQMAASYLGYEDQVFEFTVAADEAKTWDAQMSADAVGLESVVVVGTRRHVHPQPRHYQLMY